MLMRRARIAAYWQADLPILPVMRTLLRVLSGVFFGLMSVFCFCALNSYMYFFLVRTPPYLWLSGDAGYMYVTYDSPRKSLLFDLRKDRGEP